MFLKRTNLYFNVKQQCIGIIKNLEILKVGHDTKKVGKYCFTVRPGFYYFHFTLSLIE